MPSDKLFPFLAYLSFRKQAKTKQGHGVHSPFVFDLITRVFNDTGIYYAYPKIENIRQEWLQNTSTIAIQDFGAGSRIFKSNRRPINKIAQSSLLKAKHSQLLFRLVNYFRPRHIIELGSSLGISTAYLASANPNASVYSLEGCPQILSLAQQSVQKTGLANVQFVEGHFNQTLQALLASIGTVDFAFIDGNHSYEPTLQYFNWIMKYANNETVLIFDDIHWSKGMERAWNEIIADERVRISIDIFKMGLVFVRRESSKEHFKIRF